MKFGIKSKIKTLCTKQDISVLKQALKDEDCVAIDLREKEDFDSFHIDGTVNIPYSGAATGIKRFVKNKSTKITLFCYHGASAKAVCAMLRTKGYTNVVNLGGIDKWKQENQNKTKSL